MNILFRCQMPDTIRMPVIVKGKVYKRMLRPVLMYSPEGDSMEEELVKRTEMRTLGWILGVTLKEKKQNEEIRWRVGVVWTCSSKRRWPAGQTKEAEVCGRRSRGQNEKR